MVSSAWSLKGLGRKAVLQFATAFLEQAAAREWHGHDHNRQDTSHWINSRLRFWKLLKYGDFSLPNS